MMARRATGAKRPAAKRTAKRPAKKAAEPKSPAAKRMTDRQIEQIVELKLNRISTRQVASQVGCAVNTVTLHWHQWLDETSEDRRAELERHRTEAISRLDSVAAEARRALLRVRAQPISAIDTADRARAEAKFLDVERQALRALSTVAGFDAPTRVVASFDTMTEDEARALLDDLD